MDRAACDFAVRLTRAPGAMTEAHLTALREVGFDDEAILVMVQVIAYFNAINRVADALHVDLEPWMTRDRDTWLREKARDWDAVPGP